MPLPTAPFDIAKSIFAGLSVVQIKIAEQTYAFETTKVVHKDGREYGTIVRPDAKGVQRPVRRFVTKGAEVFSFSVDEAKRLVSDLFGGGLSGLTGATATIWEPDPNDATGKVALKSEVDFPCDVTRDGDLTFGDNNATTTTIAITSLKAGDVAWTADADLT